MAVNCEQIVAGGNSLLLGVAVRLHAEDGSHASYERGRRKPAEVRDSCRCTRYKPTVEKKSS